MVYEPAEDSFLLEKEIKKYISSLKNKQISVLDMGSGSGIQARACINLGIDKNKVLAADIDDKSIAHLKKLKLNCINSDLFSKIEKNKKKNNKFDLIIFNAPYLPEDKQEKEYDKSLDTTAGKQGYEIIVKFLQEARIHLNKEGRIFLLFSSLSKPKVILTKAKELGYSYKKLAEQKLFFEKLFVYEFS